jgi:hypothetical protein
LHHELAVSVDDREQFVEIMSHASKSLRRGCSV